MMLAELGRLLVVDDERDVAEFFRTIANESGLDALILQHSPDLELVLETWQPTIVVLDIMMPQRDGFEVLGALAKHAYRGHLVLVSGADTLYLEMAASNATAHGLRLAATLLKPCRREEVAQLLTRLAATR